MPNDNQIQIQIQILQAISQGKSSENEISDFLKLEGSTVDYYLDLLKENDFIQGAKAFDGKTPRLSYISIWLKSKGKVALNNPNILEENQESSRITINQSGNFGVGQMSGGKIQPGAKVAGVINEAEQQNLAEAAAEIQQLLEQLSKENPTETITQKAFVVQEAIKEIESNPTLRERIVSAIKAMGIEAVMQAIDHPLANILREGIEAFKEPQ